MEHQELLAWASRLEETLLEIASRHEESGSRTISLTKTMQKIEDLSEIEAGLLRESAVAVQVGAYRACIVLAWSAFMAAAYRSVAANAFVQANELWPNLKLGSEEDVREKCTDYLIIDYLQKTKMLSKNESRIIHGLLAQRNRAAHPEPDGPELNEALGYLSEITKYLPRAAKLANTGP